MTGLEIIINDAEVKQYIKQLPESTFKQARKVFAKAVLAADTKVKDNAANKLHVRTGALVRSLSQEVVGDRIGNLSASIYSGGTDGGKPLVYARIHEFGGTVTAKNAYKGVPGGPYLNIPLPDNKTPAGVMRMTARMVFAQGGSIGLSKKGNWIVFLEDKAMFYLKKSVTIEPRLGMRDAAEAQIPVLLQDLVNIIGE